MINNPQQRPEQTPAYEKNDSTSLPSLATFRRKVINTVIIVSITGLLILLFVSTLSIIPIIFISILVAVLLRSIANPLTRYLPFNAKWTVVLVALGLIITISLFFGVTGPSIVEQFDQLVDRIPQALDNVETELQQYDWGVSLLGGLEEVPTSIGNFDIFSRLTGFFSGVFGVLTNVALIIVAGIYMAVEPDLYIDNFVRLFPIHRRSRIYEILQEGYQTMQKWLIARLLTMLIVTGLTFIGLSLIGMPLALTLAVIAGILSFIPNIGPLLSMIPAVLVGLTQSALLGALAVLVYFVIQQIESYFITVNIQREAVALPPALIMLSQVFLVLIFGWLGLFIAAPLVAFLIVVVRLAYVEDFLGDRVEPTTDTVTKRS